VILYSLMKTFSLWFLLLILLASCNDNTFKPVPVPFATHPSVLRGNWSGIIQDFPETGQTSLIEISDSIATFCTESDDEGQCYSYTFSGNVQVGDEPVQAMVGESSASSYLYTQTSPVAPALVKFDLAFDGVTYNAEAEYWGETNYGGAIRQNADAYSFTLAKNP
jgi:hypothetical protein